MRPRALDTFILWTALLTTLPWKALFTLSLWASIDSPSICHELPHIDSYFNEILPLIFGLLRVLYLLGIRTNGGLFTRAAAEQFWTRERILWVLALGMSVAIVCLPAFTGLGASGWLRFMECKGRDGREEVIVVGKGNWTEIFGMVERMGWEEAEWDLTVG